MPDYGTVEGFKTYHTARGRDVAAYDDDDIDAAKLVASEWLDNRYRSGFGGYKVGQREQVRQWPRYSAFDVNGYAIPSNSVPAEVENATYEATLRQLQTPGGLSLDYTPGKYKRVSIDGALSAEYASFNSVSDVQSQFAIISEILAPVLTANGATGSLSGAVCRV